MPERNAAQQTIASTKKQISQQLEPPYRDPKAQTPEQQAKKLSRHYYYIIGSILLFYTIITISSTIGEDTPIDILLKPLSVLVFCFWAELHRELWRMVQGPGARTTPFKAIVLLLIPGFNLYWVFVSFCGLSSAFNKLINQQRPRDRLPVKTFGFGLPVVVSISLILSETLFLLAAIEPRLAFPLQLAGTVFILIEQATGLIFYYKLLKAAGNILRNGPQWEGTVEPPKPWEDENQPDGGV